MKELTNLSPRQCTLSSSCVYSLFAPSVKHVQTRNTHKKKKKKEKYNFYFFIYKRLFCPRTAHCSKTVSELWTAPSSSVKCWPSFSDGEKDMLDWHFWRSCSHSSSRCFSCCSTHFAWRAESSVFVRFASSGVKFAFESASRRSIVRFRTCKSGKHGRNGGIVMVCCSGSGCWSRAFAVW